MEYQNKAIIKRDLGSSYINNDVFLNDYNQNDFIKNILDFFENIILGLGNLVLISIIFLGILFFVYILVRSFLLYKTNKKNAALEIAKDFEQVKKLFIYFFDKVKNGFSSFNNSLIKKRKVVFVSLAFFLLIFVVSFFDVVDVIRVKPGQRAVDIVSEDILLPGMYLKSPFKSNYILSHVANYQFDIADITADSKELQDVILHVNVGFHLDQDKLLDFYKREGVITIWDVANSIVMPRVTEKIKNIIKNYSFKEVIDKQIEIKEKALVVINEVLTPLGIILDDINIINIRISSKFIDILGDQNILGEEIEIVQKELKKEKLKTETELEIAEREKSKKVIEAKAIAESSRYINSQRITEANLMLRRLENQKRVIESWNGVLPSSIGGDFSLLK